MDAFDALIERVAKENRTAEAKRPAPTKEQVAKEAEFLKGWAKKKPIVRTSNDSTFWKSGKYMTKIDFKMAQALEKQGHATLTGDPKKAGATLRMN